MGFGYETKEKSIKKHYFRFLSSLFVWVLLQFLAPLALPTGSVSDLSGVVAFSDNDNVIENMSFPWNVVYKSGDRLCHQKAIDRCSSMGMRCRFVVDVLQYGLGLRLDLGLWCYIL